MHTKSLARFEIKDADKGEVSAVFATIDTIDHDDDVTLKGAFENGAPVSISSYGHTTTKQGSLPVGKGSIRELKNEAVMEGRFFLDTQSGHDTFVTVKELSASDGPGQEWSYYYDAEKKSFGTFEGQRVRFLEKLKVFHVAPVERGAGIGTRTLALKSAKELPGGRTVNELRQLLREALDEATDMPGENAYMYVADFTDTVVYYELEGSGWASPGTYQRAYTVNADGEVDLGEAVEVEERREFVPKSAGSAALKFSDEAEAVLTAITGLVDRTAEVITFRAEKGKTGLSGSSVELLGRLDAEMKRLDALLRAPDVSTDELASEYLRFLQHSNA